MQQRLGPTPPEIEVLVVNPLVVRIKTAAMMMGCGTGTIYDWLRKGKIRAINVGLTQGIEVAELQRYIEENRNAPLPDSPAPRMRATRAAGVKRPVKKRVDADA